MKSPLHRRATMPHGFAGHRTPDSIAVDDPKAVHTADAFVSCPFVVRGWIPMALFGVSPHRQDLLHGAFPSAATVRVMVASESLGVSNTPSDEAIPPGWYQIGHNPNRQTRWTGVEWSGQRQWNAGAGWQEIDGSSAAVSKRHLRRDQSKVRKLLGAGILAVLVLGGVAIGVVALAAHSSKSSHAGSDTSGSPTALVAPSSTTSTLPAPFTAAPIP